MMRQSFEPKAYDAMQWPAATFLMTNWLVADFGRPSTEIGSDNHVGDPDAGPWVCSSVSQMCWFGNRIVSRIVSRFRSPRAVMDAGAAQSMLGDDVLYELASSLGEKGGPVVLGRSNNG